MDPTNLELTSGAEQRNVFWPTIRRAVSLMRAHRVALWASIGLAIGAQVFTIAIPWATGRVVDEAMQPRDLGQLRYLIILILCLAAARFTVMYLRRLIAGTMAIDIEQDLRNLLYHHLLSLSFPFFDRNQTGQLMSRATVDLSALRLFLGYGLLFFTQHIVTVVAVMTVLLWMNPLVALLVLVIVPPLVVLAVRYSRVSQPVVTESQQALAQVTTQAEESVVGIRTVVQSGATIRRSVLLGADFYEADHEAPARGDSPRLGIGKNVVLDKVIVDKNARIGDGARLVNERGVDHADGDGYYIRNGIIVVPKDGVIRPGTTI